MKPRPLNMPEMAEEDLVDFCDFLVSALQIPEVVEAVKEALFPPTAPTPKRPVARRRGDRRG